MKRVLLLAIVAGCTDGRPDVKSASITVDPGAPAELAAIAVELEIVAVDDRTVVDIFAGLYDGPVFDVAPVVPLELALPADFSPHVAAGDERLVDLENVGTTNLDLAPFCGRELVLFVHLLGTANETLEFPEEPEKSNVTRPTNLIVACP